MDFISFLNESFINALPKDEDLKLQYVDEVWNILQTQYQELGGLKGSGFKSKEDMIKNIPFWKMVRKGGIIHAVVMYKDSQGRKSVQMGVLKDSQYGKDKIKEIIQQDVKRAYTERSKGQLGLTMKTVPWDILKEFIIPIEEVKRIFKGEEIIKLSTVNKSEYPKDQVETLQKFPQLLEYGYLREIGGSFVFKVMLGTPDLGIK